MPPLVPSVSRTFLLFPSWNFLSFKHNSRFLPQTTLINPYQTPFYLLSLWIGLWGVPHICKGSGLLRHNFPMACACVFSPDSLLCTAACKALNFPQSLVPAFSQGFSNLLAQTSAGLYFPCNASCFLQLLLAWTLSVPFLTVWTLREVTKSNHTGSN